MCVDLWWDCLCVLFNWFATHFDSVVFFPVDSGSGQVRRFSAPAVWLCCDEKTVPPQRYYQKSLETAAYGCVCMTSVQSSVNMCTHTHTHTHTHTGLKLLSELLVYTLESSQMEPARGYSNLKKLIISSSPSKTVYILEVRASVDVHRLTDYMFLLVSQLVHSMIMPAVDMRDIESSDFQVSCVCAEHHTHTTPTPHPYHTSASNMFSFPS